MPLSDSFKQQSSSNLRLANMSTVPSSEDLAFALTLARKNPNNIVELPWKLDANTCYTLKVTCGISLEEPRWILNVGINDAQQSVLWNYDSPDSNLIHSLVQGECDRAVVLPKVHEEYQGIMPETVRPSQEHVFRFEGQEPLSEMAATMSALDNFIDFSKGAPVPPPLIPMPQASMPEQHMPAPAPAQPAPLQPWQPPLPPPRPATAAAAAPSPPSPPRPATAAAAAPSPPSPPRPPYTQRQAQPPTSSPIAPQPPGLPVPPMAPPPQGRDLSWIPSGALNRAVPPDAHPPVLPKPDPYENQQQTHRLRGWDAPDSSPSQSPKPAQPQAAQKFEWNEQRQRDAMDNSQRTGDPRSLTGQHSAPSPPAEPTSRASVTAEHNTYTGEHPLVQLSSKTAAEPGPTNATGDHGTLTGEHPPAKEGSVLQRALTGTGNNKPLPFMRTSEKQPTVPYEKQAATGELSKASAGMAHKGTKSSGKKNTQLPAPVDLDRAAVDSIWKMLSTETGLLSEAAFLFFFVNETTRHQLMGHEISLVRFDMCIKYPGPEPLLKPLPTRACKEAAKRIISSQRPLEMVGHYGQASFAMLLPDCNGSQAESYLKNLHANLMHRPLVPGMEPNSLTIFFGLATMPDDCQHPGVLLAAADQALFSAKRQGKPFASFSSLTS